jgi:K+/H+ antiporter YhaU regulatory subunit KhtT
MSFELLGRIQQELSITGSAIYETVLALSERANRKVQVLRLHNHASNLLSQIELGHGDLGRHIVALCAKRSPLTLEPPLSSTQLGQVLGQAGDRIQQLKQTLLNVDSQIRELKLETIHQELLTLQQDLSLRTAAIERFTIVRGSPVIGKRLAEVALPPSVRLVTILRGPFLVSQDDTLVLRVDDVLIMIGLQVDLALVSSDFTHARNGTSA